MKLSVVTVTYKSNIEELDLFIKSFFKYNDIGNSASLIIVDNSPLDYRAVQNLVDSQYKNMVSYIANPTNPGFGASNNIGFKYLPSDYVLFINNDVEFLEPVFLKIIYEFEQNPSIGCVGIHQKGGAPSFFNKMTAPKHVQMCTFDDKVHFISGAFMFFSSDVFKQIGMFDEKLFMYLEEFDLSERLIQNGYCTKFLEELSFLHKVGNRRVVNKKLWIIGTHSFCHICRKYNLNPFSYISDSKRTFAKFFFYNIFVLHWKEACKVWKVYYIRKKIIQKEFEIKKKQ